MLLLFRDFYYSGCMVEPAGDRLNRPVLLLVFPVCKRLILEQQMLNPGWLPVVKVVSQAQLATCKKWF